VTLAQDESVTQLHYTVINKSVISTLLQWKMSKLSIPSLLASLICRAIIEFFWPCWEIYVA
jgi:hypothetical protein